MADPEDDGTGREFFRVRITMDISKPLPRCKKLRSEGRQLGLVGIKYERLPSFCYWCGRVTHRERECEVWLKGKGMLRRDDQQYGDWLQAEPFWPSRKTVATISGRVRTQASWWRKSTSRDQSSSKSDNGKPFSEKGDDGNDNFSDMEAKNSVCNHEVPKPCSSQGVPAKQKVMIDSMVGF